MPAMPPAAFLAELHQRGVRVRVEGERLLIRGPKQEQRPRVQVYLRRHKPELLELLRQREREREAETLLRESYLIASARLGALPENLPAPLRLPSGRVAANVNAFVRGSVARWRHAQAKDDPDALAFAGTTWRDVAEQEAADLDACAARFAADPRDFDTDVLANAHEWFEANATD